MNKEINVINISGGKDSTAMLLLAMEQGVNNIEPVFADTGNEHEETYKYIEYLEKNLITINHVKADFTRQIYHKKDYIRAKWSQEGVPAEIIENAQDVLTPTGNPFLDLCLWKGRFPSTMAAFCSSELKRNPIIQQFQEPLLNHGFDVISWQGVRAQESKRRALLSVKEYKQTHDNGAELWNYRPILNWSVEEVFAIHKKHKIKPNPLYKKGMGRVGCMPCINCRKDELLEISKRFPKEIARIKEWERLVSLASKRGSSTFFTSDKRGHGIDQLVEWSQTGQGGQQFDFIRMDTEAPLCTSIYGLCE